MKTLLYFVAVIALSTSVLGQNCRINRNSPLYKQCGQSWSADKLGSSSTICKVGCLMSSLSSALAGLGRTINGQTATPQTLNAWLKSNGGYSGNLFVWSSLRPFGLTFVKKTSSQSEIKAAICNNKVVALNVNGGGHWVLATGVDGSSYTVNDSGATKFTFPFSGVTQAAIFSI